ncbi:type I restriction-modification system subunit M N-terminal domain-containing protein, partial [Desulfovibrio sp. SGI.169]|uniref:type I restriction-modification system subunit M N-terminal domain-containing protein n=1 Tax=Desulfovibrio sp. SGI.169 TaxID=3420561 RepID=UPI003CFE6FCB
MESQGHKGLANRLPCKKLPANFIFQKPVSEKKMGKQSTSNIGFEKQIWDAACVLRGNMDASEYKSVVLGLIFLKYISDSFEAKYQELLAAGEGDEEDRDEYTYENRE